MNEDSDKLGIEQNRCAKVQAMNLSCGCSYHNMSNSLIRTIRLVGVDNQAEQFVVD